MKFGRTVIMLSCVELLQDTTATHVTILIQMWAQRAKVQINSLSLGLIRLSAF